MSDHGLDTKDVDDHPDADGVKKAEAEIGNYIDQLSSTNDLKMLDLKTAVNKSQEALTAADGVLQDLKQLMQLIKSTTWRARPRAGERSATDQAGAAGQCSEERDMSEDMNPPARPSEEAAPGISPSMASALAGLNESLGGKRTLAGARGIDDTALESMYGIARELYANGQYAKAQQSFELLCLYDHENARYWRALGACRELSKDYLGAAAALDLCGRAHRPAGPFPATEPRRMPDGGWAARHRGAAPWTSC